MSAWTSSCMTSVRSTWLSGANQHVIHGVGRIANPAHFPVLERSVYGIDRCAGGPESRPARVDFGTGKSSRRRLEFPLSEHDRPRQASLLTPDSTFLALDPNRLRQDDCAPGESVFDDQRSRSRGRVGTGHRAASRGATLRCLVPWPYEIYLGRWAPADRRSEPPPARVPAKSLHGADACRGR